MQDTPERVLSAPTLGLLEIDQALPFHDSIKASPPLLEMELLELELLELE